MTEPTMCAVVVDRGDDWHRHEGPCGRKAKGTLADGTPACGVHLAVERRATEKASARLAWSARVDAVNEALGIHVIGWYPGEPVKVALGDLERLAARLDRNTR